MNDRYGKYKCSHVKKIACLIEDIADDLPDILQPFSAILTSRPKKPVNLTPPSCASQKPIPFELSNKLKSVLQQTYGERFGIFSGTAHLVPEVS